MKRFFRNLKSLAVVAMVGIASLAVSCAEAYDDSAIKADIADLKDRVEALEIRLGNEIDALKALIAEVEGKVVIADCEQDGNGNWILTLTDGTELNISCVADTNLTVVVENGVYYWATLVDGDITAIVDNNGNKIPVAETNPVDDAQVRQGEDGRTEISLDGGNSWIALAGDAGLFESVTVDDEAITFVLATGETFSFAIPEEFAFDIAGNAAFFASEEVKNVKVASKSIADATVIAAPAGWQVELSEKTLIVTAPSTEDVEAGKADVSGTIKVHATTNDNKCVIGKLGVSVALGYTIAIEQREYSYSYWDEDWNRVIVTEVGPVVVIRNYQQLYYDEEYDEYMYSSISYGGFYKGDMTADNVVDLLVNQNGDYGYAFESDYGYASADQIIDGAYEITMPLRTVVNNVFPMDENWDNATMEAGVPYTLWACAVNMDYLTGEMTIDQVVMVDYTWAVIDVKEVSVAFNDVQISAEVVGVDSYRMHLGTNGSWKDSFDEWQGSIGGWWPMEFGWAGSETTFEGSLFEFAKDPYSYESEAVIPGTTYELAILPMEADKDALDYTYTDVKLYTFTTAEATNDGKVNATLTKESAGYDFVAVDIEAVGTYLTFYKFYKEADYEVIKDKADFIKQDLIEDGYRSSNAKVNARHGSMKPGETVYLAVVVLDKEGGYGEVVVEPFSSNVFSYNEDLKVTLGEITCNDLGNIVYVPVEVTGGTVKEYRYAYVSNSSTWQITYGGSLETAEYYIATVPNQYYGPKFVEPEALVDGKIVISGAGGPVAGQSAHIVVIAMAEDGSASHGAYAEYTPVKSDLNISYEDDADFAYGKPSITFNRMDEDYVVYDITFAPETEEVYISVGDDTMLESWTTYSLIEDILSNGWNMSKHYTESGEYRVYYMYLENTTYATNCVFMTWKDNNGKYHQVVPFYEPVEDVQDEIANLE